MRLFSGQICLISSLLCVVNQLMMVYQSLHWATYYLADAHAFIGCRFGQYCLVIVGDGATEVRVMRLPVILLHVAPQEVAEAVQHQAVYARVVQVGRQERRQRGEEPVGQRAAVDAVDDVCRGEGIRAGCLPGVCRAPRRSPHRPG